MSQLRAQRRYRNPARVRVRWVGTAGVLNATVSATAIAAVAGLDSVTIIVSRSLLARPPQVRRVMLRP